MQWIISKNTNHKIPFVRRRYGFHSLFIILEHIAQGVALDLAWHSLLATSWPFSGDKEDGLTAKCSTSFFIVIIFFSKGK